MTPVLVRLVVITSLVLVVATTTAQSLGESTQATPTAELAEATVRASDGGHANETEDILVGTDRLRGINIATLLTQAITIYEHPEVSSTGEPQSTYTTLASYGHKLIRLPISWDFLQPNLDVGDPTFNQAYWAAVQSEVAKIGAAGMRTVLDLHNGCEWRKPESDMEPLVCGDGLSVADTTAVWVRLSNAFKDDGAVIAYDLFNEPTRFNHPFRTDVFYPSKQPFAVYQQHVNAAVAALRTNGDVKDIWVQSLCCSRFLDHHSISPDGAWVRDPIDRITYSQHMYPVPNSDEGEVFDPAKLDENFEVPAGSPWADRGYNRGFLGRLENFGRWCARHELRCAVGEVGWFGAGQSAQSITQWNALGDRWYGIANRYGMAVTYWSASSAYTGNSWAYDAGVPDQWYPAPGIARKLSPAAVIEKPENRSPR